MTVKERIFRYLGMTLLFVSFIGAWLSMEWDVFLNSSMVRGKEGVIYQLKPGTSVTKLAQDFKERKLLNHPRFFAWLARFEGLSTKLKAGEYYLPPKIKPQQVLYLMAQGRVLQHYLTVIEGWNFHEMMQSVNENHYLTHDLAHKTPAEIMAAIGHPEMKPEGDFFPDTYHFPRDTKDTTLLKEAYNLMQEHLTAQWKTRDPTLTYKSPYEALIVASLIEKETGLDRERPVIARVILRRLKRRMRLQIDATVIYGLGPAFSGELTTKNLQTKTPYNTYIIHGLPPTPIAMPGLASIYAALHPADVDYLYFVAKGDGSHVFTSKLSEHNKAVKEYRQSQYTAEKRTR